ncbi:hypothetical protein NE237_004507 [Protea cynaroides]|uniref:Uncharacterized protein n=1 Tax=Protea cynaroides TaxID=273540 RepID=A0A9Q0KIS2_9MAGN|nr:hypothetical protein NE237_004507 [Protea cynaroides]
MQSVGVSGVPSVVSTVVDKGIQLSDYIFAMGAKEKAASGGSKHVHFADQSVEVNENLNQIARSVANGSDDVQINSRASDVSVMVLVVLGRSFHGPLEVAIQTENATNHGASLVGGMMPISHVARSGSGIQSTMGGSSLPVQLMMQERGGDLSINMGGSTGTGMKTFPGRPQEDLGKWFPSEETIGSRNGKISGGGSEVPSQSRYQDGAYRHARKHGWWLRSEKGKGVMPSGNQKATNKVGSVEAPTNYTATSRRV